MTMKENTDDRRRETPDSQPAEMSEAEIDDNLEGTFPASDPPAWTLGSDHRPEAEGETDADREPGGTEQSSRSDPDGS